MYQDFPNEAAGFKFVMKSVGIALVGLVAFLFIANPMAGDASPTTTAHIVQNH